EGKVAAENERELKQHHYHARDVPGDTWMKGKPRRNQFREIIEQDAGFQYPVRQKVEPAAQWIGDRLGFEVIIKRGKIAPDGVAAEFDKRRPEHDAKD